MRIPPASTAFTLLLGFLVALPSFGIDISLPALATTGAALGVAPARAGLTMSAFTVGFAVAPLFYGPALADALPRLRRYAIALVGDVSTADDLVQDCLERTWRSRETLRGDHPIFAWLRVILHNANVDRARLRRRRPNEAESLDAVSETIAMASAPDGLPPPIDVVRAMQRLSLEHRQVLLLVALEGLSYREVAAELGLPIGTVMSRLARAREQLRGLLEGSE